MSSRVNLSPTWTRGSSPAARALEERLDTLAKSRVTALLQGEPGAGKSLAAREIHRRSEFCEEPLVAVSLVELAPSLIEAELFGHEAGAFTGALRSRVGRFVAAGRGTLVLEGVEALPSALQVKLLRALQEREVEVLGGEGVQPFQARILATASCQLLQRVREGRFREDLYYRLAVVVLDLPTLRERPEDLPALLAALGARHAALLGRAERPWSAAALELVARHAWPGNLRELENAVERLLALGSGEIQPQELDFLSETRQEALEPLVQAFLSQGIEWRAFERALWTQILVETRGNVSEAARRLGLTRKQFEALARRVEEPS
jgi:two-component system, NtrC family, response regulator HydG